jgi:flagellin
MPTVINTNLASLFAQNSLSNAQNNLATSVQRLSSGLRINSAKDDAAGLSISQNMQSQINGTNQSIRNLSDATNLLQVSDSSLSTVQDMLLRLKQLATQGYDGSLNGNQRLNLVQEMKELNNEINATAARTEFNGIKLLSQGGTTDQVNSDIKAGVAVVTTAVTAQTGANKGILMDGATGTIADVGSSTTLTVALDPERLIKLPGTYTFRAVGDQLTLNGTVDGVQTAQTLTVGAAPSDFSTTKLTQQSLNFDRFGITLNLNVTAAANTPVTGATIAAGIVIEGTDANDDGKLFIAGNTSEITSTSVTGAAAGTYTISRPAAGELLMTGSVNGQTITQKVVVATGVANTTQTVNFSAFGISFDIRSYQTHSAADITTAFVLLNGGAGVAAGEFIVSQGANSALKFQSGANSDAFIQINTRNILTASTGAYAGTATEMLTLGTRITSSAAGNLGALTKDSSIDVWQTAFKNAAAAVDTALEYISTERSVYGAQTNRLSYISNNLQAQSTNLQNSRSAIIDTDFAAETAKLTRGQIMQQAATAMLAQANQMPNVILSLLK